MADYPPRVIYGKLLVDRDQFTEALIRLPTGSEVAMKTEGILVYVNLLFLCYLRGKDLQNKE
jgi:hypothetical protein